MSNNRSHVCDKIFGSYQDAQLLRHVVQELFVDIRKFPVGVSIQGKDPTPTVSLVMMHIRNVGTQSDAWPAAERLVVEFGYIYLTVTVGSPELHAWIVEDS